MPWSPSDASKKTRKAKTKAQKTRWAKTANAVLNKTGDEAMAIRVANAGAKRKPKTLTKRANQRISSR